MTAQRTAAAFGVDRMQPPPTGSLRTADHKTAAWRTYYCIFTDRTVYECAMVVSCMRGDPAYSVLGMIQMWESRQMPVARVVAMYAAP